jgi:hypothetical protein
VASASAKRGPGARGKARFKLGRWGNIALLVVLVIIGLPLAHALFGEVVALLGGALLLGFLLGRWTAR